MYDDLESMKCTYFAALIGCDTKSATKLENIDPDRFDSTILCLQDGRAHEVFLEAAKRASGDAKRARTAPQAERGRTDGVL